jgi:hypothetical protein
MSKKKYIAPEIEILLLEQSDIITKSVGSTSGNNGGEEDEFGDWT